MAAKKLIPLDPTRLHDSARYLQQYLTTNLIGQPEAIAAVVDTYQLFLAGAQPTGRPIGSLLMLGPTGTGKTHLVELVAEALVGNSHAVIKVDCGEYQHSHEIARLLGSPPGYLGHRETPPALGQKALDQYKTEGCPIAFLLFDEIEKASDALWNLLLGVLDKATLTCGDGSRTSFEQTVVFMTSNLGAKEIDKIMSPATMGFADAKATEIKQETISNTASAAMRKKFSPEFVGRLDKVVVFNPLRRAEARAIFNIHLETVKRRLKLDNLHITEKAEELLVEEGHSLQYGARPMRKTVEARLLQPLANLLSSGEIEDDTRVIVERYGDCLSFFKEVMVGRKVEEGES